MRYVEPRPRPRVTAGRTVEVRVGCGTLYVTINEDEHGIAEVFLRLGKSGGCSASQTEAIGKLISLALRCNVNPEEIIRKLKGIRCPNTIWQDGEPITSCADAVAKTLEKYLKREFDKFRPGSESSARLDEFVPLNREKQSNEGEVKKADSETEKGKKVLKETAYDGGVASVCPDCGSTMRPSEGCYICDSCGYSKCG